MLAVIDAPIIETSALIVAPFTQITWTVAIRGLSTLNIRFAREIDASASVTLAQHRGHSCVAQACVYTLRVCFATPSDPSHIAGLKPEDDYLLGTAERVFKDPNILLDEVTAHLDQPMAFYVYNTKTDEVCE